MMTIITIISSSGRNRTSSVSVNSRAPTIGRHWNGEIAEQMSQVVRRSLTFIFSSLISALRVRFERTSPPQRRCSHLSYPRKYGMQIVKDQRTLANSSVQGAGIEPAQKNGWVTAT